MSEDLFLEFESDTDSEEKLNENQQNPEMDAFVVQSKTEVNKLEELLATRDTLTESLAITCAPKVAAIKEIRSRLPNIIDICQQPEIIDILLKLNDSLDDALTKYEDQYILLQQKKRQNQEKLKTNNSDNTIKIITNDSSNLTNVSSSSSLQSQDSLRSMRDAKTVFEKQISAKMLLTATLNFNKPEELRNSKNDEIEDITISELICPICMDDFKIEDAYTYLKCHHQYCKDCLKGFYNARITEGKVKHINCPSPGCPTEVEYYDIEAIVTKEMFTKYQDFSLLAALRENPNCRWCPKADCGTACFGTEKEPKLICSKCSYNFCFTCGEEWHPHLTCAQLQELKKKNGEADIKFLEWAIGRAKPCPRCKFLIEKNDGCNHMTCLGCQLQFCWLCLEEYTSSHYSSGPCSGKQFSAAPDPTMEDLAIADLAFLPPEVRYQYRRRLRRRQIKRALKKVAIGTGKYVLLPILAIPLAAVALAGVIAGGVLASPLLIYLALKD
eukprot:TRINITY_DN721_c0_g1_i5.p1 TRINITY_DN721_c0_g1~~TRINITY_DN721_c0_g1_i5.p1  ORF type:complete len:499 (+),score=211.00 TRINITY_DN721_c0_g1_i5:140-1636(+)